MEHLETKELIQVTQLPVIEEQLWRLKDHIIQVTKQATQMACTVETIQSVKDARTDLKKLFLELDTKRKDIKQQIAAPYDAFNKVFAECVAGPMTAADADLKKKIDAVENELKSTCEAQMKRYFDELCQAEHVKWLEWNRMGLTISLTDAKQKTHKKLQGTIAAFVVGVSQDAKAISQMENAAEIMAEYKRTLNLSAALDAVHDRHQRIEAEKATAANRQTVMEAESQVVRKVDEALPPPVVQAPVPAPAPAPAVSEKTCKATFTVHAPKSKLIKLVEFMKKEGIRYE